MRLTAAERAWIAAHPVIRVAADPAWAPVEYYEDGAFRGISVDYLQWISEATGLQFAFERDIAWSEAVAKLGARRLDIFAAAAETPARRAYATFTEPYLTLPAMIFTRSDVSFVDGIEGLAGGRVAAVEGYAVTEYLRRNQRDFELVETVDIEEALHLLQIGRVDAYVGSILVTSYHLHELGISNLQVSGQIPFQLEIAMAARSDWPELRGILNKALAAMDDTARDAIHNRWMGMQIRPTTDYRRIWQALALAVLVLLSFFGWNWYLRRITVAQRAELERKNCDLMHEVRQRARAEDQWHAASDAKTRLLANVSHEFRTPLNAIIGFSSLLRSGAAGPIRDERQVAYLDDIATAGQHLLALVNDVLDLATIDAQGLTLEEAPADLGEMVAEVIRLLRARASESGIRLKCADTAAMPTVRCDVRRLRQVLINLIDNAIKFTPAGGTVDVAWDVDTEGGVRITVADTGIGMTDAQIASAFSPFDRGADPFVRSSEGVGLGLSLASEILALHQGTLEMESREGGGLIAMLRLPARRTVLDAASSAA